MSEPVTASGTSATSPKPSAEQYFSRLFLRKAPRRSLRRIVSEFLRESNETWLSQDRTRFGTRIDVAAADLPLDASGAATLWLSFERKSIRAAFVGLSAVLIVIVAVIVHTGALAAPMHHGHGILRGWRWKVWDWDGSALARYDKLRGDLSSAFVTALIAPGALASFLARPLEHGTLSQLLRVVRAMVLLSAAFLFATALCAAMGAALWVFSTILTLGLILIATMWFVLVSSYRNCERLPARPGVITRQFVKRRIRKTSWARKWLGEHHDSSTDSALERRRRRKATIWVAEPDDLLAPDDLKDILAFGGRRIAELTSRSPRARKQPRNEPFEHVDDSTLFRVKLNRVDNLETESILRMVGGVEVQKIALGKLLTSLKNTSGGAESIEGRDDAV